MKIRLALALIRLLSWLPLRLLYFLAIGPALLLYLLPWRKHAVIRTNLALAFPELSRAERQALHRRHLIELTRLALESGAVWRWSAQRLRHHLRHLSGWDQVENARRSGQGVLLLGGHFGNWELSSLAVSLLGPFSGLYKPPRQVAVDQAVTRSRARFGARLIPAGSPAMRHMLRELKAGGTVGLLMDQLPRQGEGVYAPFFGRPALTMNLAHRLAERTGCAVFFAHAERLPRGRGWQMTFENMTAALRGAAPESAATAMNQRLERVIRRQPAQYLWLYKRFALPPTGMADPYQETTP
ncbi:MAG: lysophospholipid acyltransferase family protein [Wenzhouxiangella sp.]